MSSELKTTKSVESLKNELFSVSISSFVISLGILEFIAESLNLKSEAFWKLSVPLSLPL